MHVTGVGWVQGMQGRGVYPGGWRVEGWPMHSARQGGRDEGSTPFHSHPCRFGCFRKVFFWSLRCKVVCWWLF